MDQIKKIKRDFGDYKFVEIKKLRLKEYEDATKKCMKDEKLIMYYVVKCPNQLIKSMIKGGFIDEGTKLLVFHDDDYFHLCEGAYGPAGSKEWLISCLTNT
tara:strand:- start:87 stop:389 length:303 start_codon:yes stop_codon:yes gene_type:complete